MRRASAGIVLLLALSACGDDDPDVSLPAPTPSVTSAAPSPSPSPSPSRSPSPSPKPAPTAAAAKSCAHPTSGYTVAYPAGWHEAQGGSKRCSFFDPRPLQLEPGTEADGVAVRLDVMADPFPEARRKVEDEGMRATSEEQVDGQRAVRLQGETNDQGLLPPGLAVTTWLVDLGSSTLLLTTDEAGVDDYESSVEVLDEMARTADVG